VVQRGDGASLAFEPLTETLGAHLDRDVPAEPSVHCPIDLAHATLTDERDDFIRTEFFAWLERHPLDSASVADQAMDYSRMTA
jgi:hypothetical protein